MQQVGSSGERNLAMLFRRLLALFLTLLFKLAYGEDVSFTFNGFPSVNLSIDGMSQITSNGLLLLTNSSEQQTGHVFYPNPITFKNSKSGPVFSFSTTFVFAILPEVPSQGGPGFAFVIAPTPNLPRDANTPIFLGLFNETNNGNASNHIVAVEFDTFWNKQLGDINSNHVGIDVNSVKSKVAETSGYYDDKTGRFINLTLASSKRMQVWVEYNGFNKQLNVTLAPINVGKPRTPLLSLSRDLSPDLNDVSYIGFSTTTAAISSPRNFILGWSFKLNGQAQDLDESKLPKLPRIGGKKVSKFLTIGLPLIFISLISIAIAGVVYVIRRKRKFAEELEDWELDYGPHRFKFKDLYVATKGFRDEGLLGAGGFGSVYRGELKKSKIEIAVKRVSHGSSQGMREFVSEIVSMGRLRHRNLVTLLGYCRRKGELLLVYEFMPNGSLDRYLFDQSKVTLNWSQRFRVIKGVASGLFYLHEEWEQTVIHRDIKASNVLLDAEWNARLGDFGLARLYDHGTDPQTTRIVGTLGYMAPEHTRTGKATTSTDVFGFGAFLLEVACGRRPIEPRAPKEESLLIDWVFSFWARGELLETRDRILDKDYVAEEVELVLKLGLLCSQSDPSSRPSMGQVVQYLKGDALLPDMSSNGISLSGLGFAEKQGFEYFAGSYPSSSSIGKPSTTSYSYVEDVMLSGGR